MTSGKARLWASIGLTATALVACYSAVIAGMAAQWSTDPDMGHAFAVPFVIAWVLWSDRRRLLAISVRPSWWGLALLALAAVAHAASAAGVGLFAGSVALLLSAAGAVLCLGGFAWLRALAFPFALALFMLPKLAIVYNQMTLPLQLMASRLAAAILAAGGIGVIREGNILDVGGHRVLVAEACNGIRYLLPLAFIAVVFAWLEDPSVWMRIALLAISVPLAIAANALRVASAAAFPELDAGAPHLIFGVVVFAVCLATLALARWAFHALYVRAGGDHA
jgi:exosortase